MFNSKLSRREFLKSSTKTLAGLSVLSSAGCMQKQASQQVRAGFKLGVCDWTLGMPSDPNALKIAAELGLDGVQIDMGKAGRMRLCEPEVQKTYLQTASRNNVGIASLVILELNRIPYKSDAPAQQWVLDGIEVCRRMNLPVIMLPFFGKADIKRDFDGRKAVIENLRKAAPQAEKANVFLAIESLLSADENLEIIEAVGSPAVKVYYDVGNSNKMGYDIYEEITRLGEHICEFHAKDYNDLYGKGSMDFERVRAAMDTIGYRGWINIEGVKFPLGRIESIKYNTAYLRKIFPPQT